uniref:IP07323p n=1 Tax=Drosophila melanogaster TaxID=7227 RepID=Q4V598_DROME|nr:IP07323p [Drosophila melanogaster]
MILGVIYTYSCPWPPEWMHPIQSQKLAPARCPSSAAAPAVSPHRCSSFREWAEWVHHPVRPSNRRPIPDHGALCSSAEPKSAVAAVPWFVWLDLALSSASSGNSVGQYAAWSASSSVAESSNSPSAFAPRR